MRIELHLYEETDADIIQLCERLDAVLAKPVLLNLATLSLHQGRVDLQTLQTGRKWGASKDRKVIKRSFTIRPNHYPSLVQFWEALPAKTRSRVFISLIKTGLSFIRHENRGYLDPRLFQVGQQVIEELELVGAPDAPSGDGERSYRQHEIEGDGADGDIRWPGSDESALDSPEDLAFGPAPPPAPSSATAEDEETTRRKASKRVSKLMDSLGD